MSFEQLSFGLMGLTDRFALRLWRRVQKTSGCWLWTGSLSTGGYGTIRSGGKKDPWLKTHRASWMLHFGPIPSGLHVLHRCDTPACVRPDHLFLGTPSDNMRDMFAKGRHRGATHRETYLGERNGRSKLTEDQVRDLRRRSDDGESPSRLAFGFGLSRTSVRSIIRRARWRHVA